MKSDLYHNPREYGVLVRFDHWTISGALIAADAIDRPGITLGNLSSLLSPLFSLLLLPPSSLL
jgi:hypothetical protein